MPFETMLNRLLRSYRKPATPEQLHRLIIELRTYHEATQQTRLIFETDPVFTDTGLLSEASEVRCRLLNLESAFLNLATITEDRLEPAAPATH